MRGRRGAVGNVSDSSQLDACEFHLIKGSNCFFEQETLPSLLSTGWFQEWIGA